MKKNLVSAMAVLALGCTIGLLARLVANMPFNAPTALMLVGGAFAGGLLLLAFSDYSRHPRFRVRPARKTTSRAGMTATSAADPSYAWTYTTRSA